VQDISKVKSPIVSEIKKIIASRFTNSKKEFFDNKITYQASLTEKEGGNWKDFHNFFFEICRKFEDQMNFDAPGCHKCIFNGDTSIHFFEEDSIFLLFVEMDFKNENNPNYIISISQCRYNDLGLLELEKYKKEL